MTDLPKISTTKALGSAGFNTFVKPTLMNASWALKQYSPKQMAYNMLSGNVYGQKALQFAYAYNSAKNPDTAGFSNKEIEDHLKQAEMAGQYAHGATGMGSNYTGGTSTNESGVIKLVGDQISSGFNKMVSELRAIRQTVLAVARIGSVSAQTGTTTSSKISTLIDTIKTYFGTNKFKDAEANIEKHSDGTSIDTSPDVTKTKFSIFKSLLLFGEGFIAEMVLNFKKFGLGIKTFFGNLKIEKLLEPITKGLKFIAKPFEGIFKLLEPLAKFADIGLIGKLAKLGDGIPVIGEFIIIFSSLIDGVKGFVEAFSGTKGSLFQRVIKGLDGAIQGVTKGLLDIPKMLLQMIKGVSEFILNMFGFNDLANKLKNFNVGKMWDDSVGQAIKNFKPVEWIAEISKTILDWIISLIKNLPSNVKDLAGAIRTGANAVANAAADATHQAVDNAGKAIYRGTHGIGSQTTFSKDIPLEGRAFLDSLRDTEGTSDKNGYNRIVGGGGFDASKGEHPNQVGYVGPHGPSTAAGAYQIEHSTWLRLKKEYPDLKFDQKGQDSAAWLLAQEDYKRKTGNDLASDLKKSKGNEVAMNKIASALSPTWTSLYGGSEQYKGPGSLNKRFVTHMQDEMNRDAPQKIPNTDPHPGFHLEHRQTGRGAADFWVKNDNKSSQQAQNLHKNSTTVNHNTTNIVTVAPKNTTHHHHKKSDAPPLHKPNSSKDRAGIDTSVPRA